MLPEITSQGEGLTGVGRQPLWQICCDPSGLGWSDQTKQSTKAAHNFVGHNAVRKSDRGTGKCRASYFLNVQMFTTYLLLYCGLGSKVHTIKFKPINCFQLFLCNEFLNIWSLSPIYMQVSFWTGWEQFGSRCHGTALWKGDSKEAQRIFTWLHPSGSMSPSSFASQPPPSIASMIRNSY